MLSKLVEIKAQYNVLKELTEELNNMNHKDLNAVIQKAKEIQTLVYQIKKKERSL